MFHTGHSVLGKMVGKRIEFKSNQSGTFPEAKQPCEFVGNRAPKEAILHCAGCQGSASRNKKQARAPALCRRAAACASSAIPVPGDCGWAGSLASSCCPSLPPGSRSAGDCQPDPPLAGSFSHESPKGEFPHNRSLLADLHRAEGKPSPPSPFSTPAQRSSC